jgi:tetratricopeptide (TPR) repeat protein
LTYLKKNPQNLNALANIAEIYYYRGEQDKAMDYCIRALKINTYHAWTNFIYANINKDKGNLADAIDGYRFAMRSPEFRSPSFELLAELNLKEQKYEEAIHLAGKSLNYDKNNINTLKVLAIANRLLDNIKEAEKIQNEMLDLDPLNHFAMFERFLITKNTKDKNIFINSFHNEMAKEDFLNMGIFYAELGLKEEAVKILTLAPDYTLINYWLAYLNQNEKLAEEAITSDPLMVFPYRIKSLKVFNWVNSIKPSWKTDYYKSLILWNKGRKHEALSVLNKWKEIPDFPPFYYSRSCLNDTGSDSALKDMKKALETDPDQWRLYKYLADLYNQRKEYQKAVDIAKKGRDKYPESYVLDIAYAYALSLTENYKESLKVLSKINVLPFEGENRAQKIYFRNYMMLALTEYQKQNYNNVIKLINKSEQYPRIFGSGSPTYPDYRGQEYLKAKAYEKMGEKDKAEKIYNDIINFYNPNKKDFPEQDYSKLGNIFALMEKGKEKDANKLLDEWASNSTGSSGTWEKNDPSDIGEWVKAVINNDAEKKAELDIKLTKEYLSSDNLVIYRIIKQYVELRP